MAMDLKEIEKMIKEALPDASIDIQDLAGDGNHYSATVTSSEFKGKNKVQQHKMVYDALIRASYTILCCCTLFLPLNSEEVTVAE